MVSLKKKVIRVLWHFVLVQLSENENPRVEDEVKVKALCCVQGSARMGVSLGRMGALIVPGQETVTI